MADNIVKCKDKNGAPVEFVYKDPKQGGVKDVYFSPDKSYVVAFYRKKLDLQGRDRLEKIVGQYRQRIFEEAGGDYWRDIFCWPERLLEYEGKVGLVVPTYQSKYFFKGGNLDGAEKEGKWFTAAKNFNRFVPPQEKGDLTKFIRLCLNLSRGVRRLHAAGLSHSDLSYKNCLVDPSSGSACIIDVDGLVVPGLYPPDVLGTPDFIAPEVVASAGADKSKRVLPSRKTDLHALAVLIYLYLFHRHPLRGRKVWSVEDQDLQEKYEMGEKAIFIENPDDASNRPSTEDQNEERLQPWSNVEKFPYSSMGPYLKEMFERAFIEGLHNPNMRPSANDWEDALMKTTDLYQRCPNPQCVNKFFVYNNQKRPRCPYCGAEFKLRFPILDFYVKQRANGKYINENRRMAIFDGQPLCRWHLDRHVVCNEKLKPEDKKRVGYFQLYKDRWYLRNETAQGMRVISEKRDVKPGDFVELKENQQILLDPSESGRLAVVRFVN